MYATLCLEYVNLRNAHTPLLFTSAGEAQLVACRCDNISPMTIGSSMLWSDFRLLSGTRSSHRPATRTCTHLPLHLHPRCIKAAPSDSFELWAPVLPVDRLGFAQLSLAMQRHLEQGLWQRFYATGWHQPNPRGNYLTDSVVSATALATGSVVPIMATGTGDFTFIGFHTNDGLGRIFRSLIV